jgi:probable HAF family extracellular repeat protein
MNKQLTMSVCWAGATGCVLAGTAAGQVTITDLGTLDETPSSYWGHALNNNGQVVGHRESQDGSIIEAFLWQNDQMQLIGSPGGFTTPEGINDQGQVAGSTIGMFGVQAFVWHNGQMLPLSGSSGQSTAEDINDGGLVVGMREINGVQEGYVWDTAGETVTGLSNLGAGNSRAIAINNGGQVIGWSFNDDGHREACLWFDGQATPLGTMGTSSSWAKDINDQGRVVGYTNVTLPSQSEAFVWDPQNGMTGLGGQPSRANGINEHGQIVGRSQGQAFLYEDGQMTPLIDLLPEGSPWTALSDAAAINEAGQIVGIGIRNGQVRAFLMSVPTACPADVTADGQVNVDDLMAVVLTWGEAGSPNDIDNNGLVDVQDLVEVLLGWGSCEG